MAIQPDHLPVIDRQTARRLLPRVYGLVRPFLRHFWIVNVLTFLVIAAEVCEVRLIGNGFTRIEELGRHVHVPGHASSFFQALRHPPEAFLESVRTLAIIILALAMFRAVLKFANRLAMSQLGEKIIWRLRVLLLRALQRQSFSYYDRNYSGQLINRIIGDVQQVRSLVNIGWFTMSQAAVYILGYFALMLYIHPLLAIVSVATVPLCVWLLLRLSDKLRQAFHEARQREDNLITALQENIAGAQVVKAFAREQAETDKFHGLASLLLERTLAVVELFRRHIPVFWFLIRVNLVLMLGVGGALVMLHAGQPIERQPLKISDLLVFSVAVMAIGGQLRMVVNITNQVQESLASTERLFEILDAQPDVEELPNARPLPPGNGEVVFEHVSFGYDPRRPVLNDVSLHVWPGEVVAVVGPTGCGKSTLTHLLPRFYDPDHGRVLIDSMPVNEATLLSLRQNIGLVFQETFLFSDTVANNIAFGAPEADFDDIVTAAKIARAHEFIETLENGYETIIGERGVTLSGGQQQRLAIARAIVKNPRILILDDALASVDSATEHEITTDLEAVFAHRTVFIIAHRLSSLKRADRILVMEDGRITAEGTHAELMARDGHYRRTAELQIGRHRNG